MNTIENERGTRSIVWLPFESEIFTSAAYGANRHVLCLRFRKTGDVYQFEFPAAE
jgi:hypothetical protein